MKKEKKIKFRGMNWILIVCEGAKRDSKREPGKLYFNFSNLWPEGGGAR